MSSDTEEYNEEENLDCDWPEDYFVEAIKEDKIKEYKPKPPTKTFDDLNQDVLRRIVEPLGLNDRCSLMLTSLKLKEAVESSKWDNLGNGKMIVSAVEKPTGLIVHVTLGRLITVTSLDENWEEKFTMIHRLFKLLHLKELRLNNVPLDHDLLQSVNAFIDSGISFDSLSFLRVDKGPFGDRTLELIARAKQEVVFNMHTNTMSRQQLLSFTRPIKLTIERDKGGGDERMALPEDVFMDLVRRGHSLINFKTSLNSVEALAEVIEKVSASPFHQMCDFHTHHGLCREYLDKFEVPQLQGAARNILQMDRKYHHLGATITLKDRAYNHRGQILPPSPGSVCVKSKDYPEEKVEKAQKKK